MSTITITGDNNYTGVYAIDADHYSNFWVLGGANYAGHTDFDAVAGDEVFVFGNLSYRSTTITDTTYDGSGTAVTCGTYNTTATATSADTLHFGFTFDPGSEGGTFHFLTDLTLPHAPQDYASDAIGAEVPNGFNPGDGDADIQSHSDDSAWNSNYAAWQTLLNSTYGANNVTYSDPTTIETNVSNGHPDPDVNITLDVTATVAGTASLTADYGGDKVLLGFSVGSDKLAFDNVTEDLFDQYFAVTSSTHISANNNTVHDTIISLNDGSWSVDLYGVDITGVAGDLHDWAWANVISHV